MSVLDKTINRFLGIVFNAAGHDRKCGGAMLLRGGVQVCGRVFLVGVTFSFSSVNVFSEVINETPFVMSQDDVGNGKFQKIDAGRSGLSVVNSYDDPKMWGERYQEMAFGAIGTGLAIGDYDNDGLPDLFLPVKTGGSRLYRNRGDFVFEDVTKRAGLLEVEETLTESLLGLMGVSESRESVEKTWDQGAIFVDVDNDGWLDLYVTSFSARNRLYINRGDGTFSEESEDRGLDVLDGSGVAAFCDYDRDGFLDMYLQTNLLDAVDNPEGRKDRLFRNVGDGYYEEVTEGSGISGVTAGHSVVWWDYDRDGWPDLYVANDFKTPDQLYRNNGDGTFEGKLTSAFPHTPYYSMGSDVGDVNNDGLFDLFVGDMAPTSREKDLRGMAVSRSREMVNQMGERTPQWMRNCLFLNSGMGRFMEIAWSAGVARSDWTWSTRLEDLDCDGWLDLHITNGMVREYHNVDILNRVMGGETRMAQRRIMKSSPVLAEENLVFRNVGESRFESVGTRWGLDETGVSFGAVLGDLDGDGDLDLVYSNFDGVPSLFRNDVAQGTSIAFELRGVESNSYGIGSVVTIETESGIQVRDLASSRGYLSGCAPVVHFGLGDAKVVQSIEVRWPSGTVQTLKNLSSGYRYVIRESAKENVGLVANSDSTLLSIVKDGANEGQFTKGESLGRRRKGNLVPFGERRQYPHGSMGDWNGDGSTDAVFRSGPNELLFAQSTTDGSVHERRFATKASGPFVLCHLNADTVLDLLVLPNGEGEKGEVYLNDGLGEFVRYQDFQVSQTPLFPSCAIACDLDGDGYSEVFVGSLGDPDRYPVANKSVLLSARSGQFEDVSALLPDDGLLGLVSGAKWADCDHDGHVDLVLAREWDIPACLLNSGNNQFRFSEGLGFESAGRGLWTGLEAGDFNNDGIDDFVLGNIGLNTPYRASALEPLTLFASDFGGEESWGVIETRIEDGKLYPIKSLRDLKSIVPDLKHRFKRNDDFAKASLVDVAGADQLSKASRYDATELRSGVLLSDPGKGYRFVAFSQGAQSSPMRGIAIGDLDGNGHLDIAATQNLWDVNPTMGRLDGGLGQILLGDGDGGFSALQPSESGFWVVGDGGGIAISSDAQVWVEQGLDPLLVFRRVLD